MINANSLYCKDRLKNSVLLFLSVCIKWSILLGQGNSIKAVYKQQQAKIQASKILNKINVSCYTESQELRLH